MMISLCFIVSDPQHIHRIMNHIISGNKLNSSGDYFRYLLDESQHRRRFGKTILDSALLLPLLNPPRKEVLVVPKGTIYRQFNMQPPIENHGKLFSKLRQGFTITMNDGIATISYIDQRAKIRTINVHERNGTYTYEDFSTDSLYELFVRTSIFAQIYGTFEQQHVALTEENIDLEPIDQPWFFGAISDEEADEILSNAAPAPAIITRSIGADICVCYTRTKFLHNTRRSNYRLTMKFRDIFTRTNHSYPRFYSALYNGGERKNLWVYLTYRTVVSKPLDEIIKFIKDNGINLSDPAFQTPNLLEEYSKATPKIDPAIVRYLIDQGFPPSEVAMDYLTYRVPKTNYDLIFWLIEKGAKLSHTVASRAIQSYCPDISSFKIYVDATINNNTISDSIILTGLKKFVLTDTINPTPKTRENLVKLAWKFGNEDNYFKKLPKELIEVICRSTDIDRPDWWDIMAPFIVPVDSTKLFINLPIVGLFELAPFVNNYWDKLHCNVKKYYAARLIEQFPIVAKSHQDKARMIVKWTLNFARILKSFYFVNSVARDIFTFATLNDFAQPLLEAMLSITQPNSILGCLCSDVGQGIDLSPAGISQIVKPATWGAVLVNNRPLIKFFLEKGYLHFDMPNASIDRLTELVKSTYADTSGLDYLRQLMSK